MNWEKVKRERATGSTRPGGNKKVAVKNEGRLACTKRRKILDTLILHGGNGCIASRCNEDHANNQYSPTEDDFHEEQEKKKDCSGWFSTTGYLTRANQGCVNCNTKFLRFPIVHSAEAPKCSY